MNARLSALSIALVVPTLMVACSSPMPLKEAPAAAAVTTIDDQPSKPSGNLYRAVEEHVRSQGSVLADTQHQIAYTDLNDDGAVDALLMLNGPKWCIGESCTLMIFEGTSTGARLQAELTLISSPVTLGSTSDGNWRDIYVTLPGSAGMSNRAQIRHDGQVYPESPGEWHFLTDNETMPGNAILVADGASVTELASIDQLMVDSESGDESVATAAATLEVAENQNFYGRYSWGPGEAYFRPCGGSSVYWVSSEANVAEILDQQYRQIATQQFDDVYLEIKGSNLPPPKEGDASFYDGVLQVEQVILMEGVDSNTCSKVPSS